MFRKTTFIYSLATLLLFACGSRPDGNSIAYRNLRMSLEVSRDRWVQEANDRIIAFRQTKMKNEPERAQPFYDKALIADSLTQRLDTLLDSLRAELIAEGDGFDTAINDVRKYKDRSIARKVLLRNNDGARLRLLINDTRENMLLLLDS